MGMGFSRNRFLTPLELSEIFPFFYIDPPGDPRFHHTRLEFQRILPYLVELSIDILIWRAK